MAYIAVVEDDNSINKLITYALTESGYQAEGFSDGSTFLASLNERKPDLILLDIMLPGIDGIEVLNRIRKSSGFSRIPIMMLTARSSEIDKVSALDQGADDYMTKPFGVMELLSRVRALLRRSSFMEGKEPQTSKVELTCGKINLSLEKRRVKVCGEKIELTYKEFELLKYLLENKGIVLSRDKIMQNVWGYDYEGESRTVDMHIKWLRHKLGEAGDYIRTIRGIGYCISDEE